MTQSEKKSVSASAMKLPQERCKTITLYHAAVVQGRRLTTVPQAESQQVTKPDTRGEEALSPLLQLLEGAPVSRFTIPLQTLTVEIHVYACEYYTLCCELRKH